MPVLIGSHGPDALQHNVIGMLFIQVHDLAQLELTRSLDDAATNTLHALNPKT
jgi:hypothetical protein